MFAENYYLKALNEMKYELQNQVQRMWLLKFFVEFSTYHFVE